MTPTEFIRKWKPVALTERAAAHTHFLDLCKLLEHEDPVSADPTGKWFTFEKGASKSGGGEGFADVWKRNYFAWEYKKKKRDLNAALDQLVRYAAALENPPLQVACDTDRFIIRTAWTNTVPKFFEIELDDLVLPEKREILWAVFHDPERLRPDETRAGVTKEAADKFSAIASRLNGKGTPEDIAHFINQLVFCFFASSVKLLPDGFFHKLLTRVGQRPERAQDYFNSLFEAMEHGGEFDLTDIAHFNGGLFDGRRALPLDQGDIELLVDAGGLDWSMIDPTIFGTLFERFLDPGKRAQIGAHYTDPEKISMIIEPVILRPLRDEWEAVKASIAPIAEKASGIIPRSQSPGDRRSADQATRKLRSKAMELRDAFLHRLATVRILDPACGSGNFLYLALQGIKDLENRVVLECEAMDLQPKALQVGPEIVHGIEINPFAAELARTTIWIGDIQWRRRNGIYSEPPPILRKLDTIECRDAIIAQGPDGAPIEAEWPPAEFIVGNPPFLGAKWMLDDLGEQETEHLRLVYESRVPTTSDLVVYWFEKARASLASAASERAGFVATNMIRGVGNRKIMEEIVDQFGIFEAWSDEPWIVDGADVRVSLVCFSRAKQTEITWNGKPTQRINADLTSGNLDLTLSRRLVENENVAVRGIERGGSFDVSGNQARDWLRAPSNPNGRSNADVLRPFALARELVRRPADKWIIDFSGMTEAQAALYELPYQYAVRQIKQARSTNREVRTSRQWWLFRRSGQLVKEAIDSLDRYIVTGLVWKHRLFTWLPKGVLPDTRLVVIARDDDTTFGVLSSRFHTAWTLRICQYHGVGNDPVYTQGTTFETFPFPDGLTPNISAEHYADDGRAQAIATAARELHRLRSAWLTPPELVKTEPEVVSKFPDRILPTNAAATAALRSRTLTNLYNEPPRWLLDAHAQLDRAVAHAYGWPDDISETDALAKLLDCNLVRLSSSATGSDEDLGIEEE
ncbi:class I SAM-dependent DNA methyltransferase [Bradyrhizobium brasilense]|uniref:class I SAM-dependent DNA methyltransferase n=1 Tax=Bradyrhizobium brasilense TaxID=1419277 RepID=UPI0014570CEB|nr:DNA methyltransferase [Bradyrhizobium brasilense]NLS69343.1 class I SAM-dependent DNA methyltransferase [Bradyrhizobium brasilense]